MSRPRRLEAGRGRRTSSPIRLDDFDGWVRRTRFKRTDTFYGYMSIERRAAIPLVLTMRAVLGNLMAAGRDRRPRTVTGLKGNADADAPSGVELTSDSPET